MPRSVLVQRVLGLAFAVVFGAASLWALGRTPEPRPVATSATSASTSATASATTPSSASTPGAPASGPASTSGAASPSAPASAPLASSGPGLTQPGIHVVAQAGPDGGL